MKLLSLLLLISITAYCGEEIPIIKPSWEQDEDGKMQYSLGDNIIDNSGAGHDARVLPPRSFADSVSLGLIRDHSNHEFFTQDFGIDFSSEPQYKYTTFSMSYAIGFYNFMVGAGYNVGMNNYYTPGNDDGYQTDEYGSCHAPNGQYTEKYHCDSQEDFAMTFGGNLNYIFDIHEYVFTYVGAGAYTNQDLDKVVTYINSGVRAISIFAPGVEFKFGTDSYVSMNIFLSLMLGPAVGPN